MKEGRRERKGARRKVKKDRAGKGWQRRMAKGKNGTERREENSYKKGRREGFKVEKEERERECKIPRKGREDRKR